MTCHNLLSDDDGFKEKFLKMKQQCAIFFPKKTLYMSQGFFFLVSKMQNFAKNKKIIEKRKTLNKTCVPNFVTNFQKQKKILIYDVC